MPLTVQVLTSGLKKQLTINVFCVLFFSAFISPVFSQPLITSFSPASGPIGTPVTITGSNFSTTPANNIVYFGAVKATVTAASATSLTVTVPSGTTYQPVTVTVSGLTAYSQRPFQVTFSGGGTINGNAFGAIQDFTTGIRPNAIAIADFDGDGKADVATPNNHSSGGLASVSVLRNISSTGTIDFAPKQDMVTGGVTYCIGAGDIDGDGKPDIVAGSIEAAVVSVFRNTSTSGNVSFAPKVDFTITGAPYDIAIKDFDGDGKTDLAVLDNGILFQGLSVFRNTGSTGVIAFAPKVDFTTQLSPKSIVATDLDGDGKTDIAFTNQTSNSFSVYRNTGSSGTISFAPRVDITCGAGNQPFSITTGDLDNDTKTDVIVVINNNTGGGAQLFRNTGSPGSVSFTFNTSLVSGSSSNTCYHAGVNDINGDGKPDIAMTVAGSSSGQSQLYQNNTTGSSFSFGTANNVFSAFAPYGIGFSDLEGDGRPDLVISEFTMEKISVYKNKCGTPAVTSFTPTSAGANGTVTINGSNFTGVTSVRFGGVSAATFGTVNATTISATVSSGGASGDVEVTNAIGSGSRPGFIFIGPPVITSFTPVSGFNGTSVTITGNNFNNASAVSFGGTPAASFTVNSPTTITAFLSTGSSGSVSVTTPFGTGSLSGFTYAPVPIVFSFTPTTAATGNSVSISGLNFTGTTAVSFGGVPASGFTVVDQNNITAVVGIGASGDVAVTNAFGTASKPGFTYIPQPVITSFTPLSAGAGGVVTISGSNFTGATVVKFGFANASSFTVVNANTITATLSASGASGAVSVTTPGGTATLAGFTFIQPPVISSFTPAVTGQGGLVTITGTNFSNATAVRFGGTAASSFTVNSSTSITATVAGGSSGQVSVTTAGGTGVSNGFDFITSPVIHSVSPLSGPVGTIVTITGANFGSGVGANAVYFGGVRGSVVSAAPNVITVAVPAGAMNLPIRVSTLGSALNALSKSSFKVTFTGDPNAFDANSFSGKMNFTVGARPTDIDLGDMDGDGKPDMIVVNYNANFISVFRNTSTPGQLSFAARNDITTGQYVNNIVATDINSDGKLDLAMARGDQSLGGNSEVIIYTNTSTPGAISFASPQVFAIPYPLSIADIAVGDLNSDGRQDIVGICNNCAINSGGRYVSLVNTTTSGVLSFNINQLFFAFSASANTLMGGIEIIDYNNDNKPEILIGTTSSSGEYLLLLTNNTMTGGPILNFGIVTVGSAGGARYCLYPFPDDVNADGQIDVLTTNWMHVNQGGYTFTRQVDLNMGRGVLADLNGDGKSDIVCQGTTFSANQDKVALYRNTSANPAVSFASPFYLTANGNSFMKIVAGDLDADGKPEICSANLDSNSISIFRNRIGEATPPAPTVTSFTPASGSAQTQVTITGTNFNQATSVTFGNTPASFFTVVSPTSIVAIVGIGASGDVAVTTPGGTGTLAGFTYVAAPVVTSFSPASAFTGATVTITGANFTGVTAISFGGTPASSFTVVNATTINAVVGTGASGAVSVTNANGTASSPGFTYTVAPPVISSFTPTTSGTGGTVTITGTNFTGTTAVLFGGIAASSFTVVNATTITAIVGSGATGNVSVVTPGGTATLNGFTFTTGPSISSFTPATAGTNATVTITGTNFTGATSVSFGGVQAVSFSVVNATTITAVVGAGASGNVSVTTSGGTATRAGFIYNPVTAVTPPIAVNTPELTATPNPGNALITIRHPSSTKESSIRFVDVVGKTVKQIDIPRNRTQTVTDVSSLPGGIYYIIWEDDKRRYARVFMAD